MTQAVTLEVNGSIVEYANGSMPTTVSTLIDSLGLDENMVVAEVNGVIVKRGEAASCALKDGDKVELVRFVGGG